MHQHNSFHNLPWSGIPFDPYLPSPSSIGAKSGKSRRITSIRPFDTKMNHVSRIVQFRSFHFRIVVNADQHLHRITNGYRIHSNAIHLPNVFRSVCLPRHDHHQGVRRHQRLNILYLWQLI